MSHYTDLTDELKVRIRAAWGAGFLISCGRPKVPFATRPYAVISIDPAINSQNQGRQKFWTWTFKIIGIFDFDASSDSESLMMAKIYDLIQQLEPFTEDGSVPSPEGAFAGIGHQHYVTQFNVLDEAMEDDFIGCSVTFVVETCVHA